MNEKSQNNTRGGIGAWAREFRKSESYPVIYMFFITAFFSAVLIGIARSTQERVDANQQIKVERAILMAVIPDEITDKTPSAKVHQVFTERIEQAEEMKDMYRLVQNGQLQAYAVMFAGQGFWDTIRGVIGFSPDKTTVLGIAFYEQAETPGLGAEITQPDFREQFESLKVTGGEKTINFVSPGTEPQAGEVQAITGATQTSARVEVMVNNRLREWLDNRENTEEGSSEI